MWKGFLNVPNIMSGICEKFAGQFSLLLDNITKLQQNMAPIFAGNDVRQTLKICRTLPKFAGQYPDDQQFFTSLNSFLWSSWIIVLRRSCLLDPAFEKRWCLTLSLWVPRNLFVCLWTQLTFFQNASSRTFIIRFFSYYTHIIRRGSYIWLVLGLAIWRVLAHWRPSTFFLKKIVLFIETRQLDCDFTMVLFWIRCWGAGEWDTWNWGHSQPISIEGSYS